ncbi:MAG: hypothetical protein DI556_22665 [Rhodovulum sulfidophilum]|uniref:Peptidase M10 serralysin C-terminal domain-containing protein n=1 Tax=Rhodovulum sulfidophilum TaxID=35806 RepID=A0A2W5MXE7_RHOSU|nr:MAG: hypothetical protein DI556_22665 [Rhodovulum sulfidophilum]
MATGRLPGGPGNDLYIITSPFDSIVEAANGGIDTVRSSIDYTLPTNVENLELRDAADYGAGNTLNNVMSGHDISEVLDGKSGNDTLFGYDGFDQLKGDTGNDWIDGGAGKDIMVGGAGNDVFIVDDVYDVASEQSGGGIDTVQSAINYQMGQYATYVENLVLLDGAASGVGNNLANEMTGNAGNNQLDGISGADTLMGLGGNDRLIGGLDNDRLNGGLGMDVLTGGSGSDRFVFTSAAEAGKGSGRDQIVDFIQRTDKIALDFDADTTRTGDQAFKYIGGSSFSKVAGQLRSPTEYGPSARIVQGDINGDGVADFEISVGGLGIVASLGSGDFLL